jgi:SAM-dependent methyltransferase
MAVTTDEDAGLHHYIRDARNSWREKSGLRTVYNDYYQRLLEEIPAGGRILEIGAGSGHSQDAFQGQDVTRLDILDAPWIDLVADAHAIPLDDASFDAIVMIDVLHHLQDPPRFIGEVRRLLRPGGRCVMIEPAITPLAGIFLRLFHQEPVDMSVDPFVAQRYGPDKDPFDSNQAIPTLMFRNGKARARFGKNFPGLNIRKVEWFSLFAYPLTGGFRPWSLLNGKIAGVLLKVESALTPLLGRLMGFRLLISLEKSKKNMKAYMQCMSLAGCRFSDAYSIAKSDALIVFLSPVLIRELR